MLSCKWKFNIVQSRVHHTVNPNPYRGVFGFDGPQYAKDVQDIIEFGTTGRVARFIAETIQGVGGADELVDLIMRCVLDPGDKIIDCPPTFTMYEFDAGVNGETVIKVPRLSYFILDVFWYY